MARYLWQHLEQILQTYKGELPLHYFLKQHFRQHPKLGSRDRRGLSDAVYAWYRAGKAINPSSHTVEMLRLAAMYLCGLKPKAFAGAFPEHWEGWEADVDVRIKQLEAEDIAIDFSDIFPESVALSEGVTVDGWRQSMLRQPRLFLRIRKDKGGCSGLLKRAGVLYEWISDNCLALANSTKVEELLPHDNYVVQDASSQATGALLKPKKDELWWDCCSGAGGKSLMLVDSEKGVNLLTTDVRESILQNLADRFRRYHLPKPQMMTLDVADSKATAAALGDRKFDGIICDVPCTGSGTWARTPENCYFFEPAAIAEYSRRQEAILSNATSYLKEGGKIIYITCSVFREENENVINAVAAKCGMQVVSSGIINGADIGADALFAAELRKA
jgi:16S rRNA (cytosine967-C5)-methyltransferase